MRPHRSLVAASAALLSASSLAVAVAGAAPAPVSASTPPDDAVYGTVTVTGAPLPPFDEAAQSGAVTDPAIGAPVPVVSGAGYDGRPVTIDPATQGPTLVVLISHWCPHCNVMVDAFAEWRRSSAPPKQLRIVGISVAADPEAENFPPDEWLASDADWRWPVIADDEEMTGLRAYGGTSFPMFVLVSSSGATVWRSSGEQSMDTITSMIDEALAAEGVG